MRELEGSLVKHIGLLRTTSPAFVIAMLSLTGFAAARNSEVVSQKTLRAKIQYCEICHGPSGRGMSGGYIPIPRIAGQTSQYIKKQLLAFAESMRDRNGSLGITSAHSVSPAMRSLLAKHFTGLTPGTVGGGPRDRVAVGKKIYDEGVPAANVAACSGCHGPDGKGKREIPRLAGQLDSYTNRELSNWSKLRGQNPLKEGAAAPMKLVAQSLSSSQIAALAAYLSHLKN